MSGVLESSQHEKDLLEAKGHVLVMGGPGSGKTTLALKKARHKINEGLKAGQSVLFLSFSRAAVKRLLEASSKDLTLQERERLNLQTFHSFFWTLLSCHSYLLGVQRPLQILLPHDERALSFGITEEDQDDWARWVNERERLFFEEGKIAFDLFAGKALELIEKSSLIKKLISQKYPLIIVDEAQDTGEIPWKAIHSLSDNCQIICLADIEQQIFDYLPGIGPERIDIIKENLSPLIVDLGQKNNRSPGTEIAKFGHDVLHNSPKGSPYDGASKLVYDPNGNLNLTLRRALAITYRKVRTRGNTRPDSCAILVSSSRELAHVTAALSNEHKPVPHKVVFDVAHVLLASRFAAYLLEPKQAVLLTSHIVDSLELLSAYARASGTKAGRQDNEKYQKWIVEYRAGRTPRKCKILASLSKIISDLSLSPLVGDPKQDWLYVKSLLKASEETFLSKISKDLDYLVAFGRGKTLYANFLNLWTTQGNYLRARQVFDSTIAQESIIESSEDQRGILVMTIHRSKGKQFDGVIILRRGIPIGPKKWGSSFVWRNDTHPFPRSRKILRVAITRAKKHVLILEPPYPACPLLAGHVL